MHDAPNKRMQSDKMDAARHFAADARRYVSTSSSSIHCNHYKLHCVK